MLIVFPCFIDLTCDLVFVSYSQGVSELAPVITALTGGSFFSGDLNPGASERYGNLFIFLTV